MASAAEMSPLLVMKASLAIIFGSIGLACALGLALDSVTAHVAVEYFTVYHPKVVESEDPWIMALIWGVIASWWFGLIAGAILAIVNARLKPPVLPKRVLAVVARACAALWALMILVLVSVYALASLVPEAKRGPSFESDRRLMAVAMAHQNEYVFSAIAIVVVGLRLRRISRKTASTNRALR